MDPSERLLKRAVGIPILTFENCIQVHGISFLEDQFEVLLPRVLPRVLWGIVASYHLCEELADSTQIGILQAALAKSSTVVEGFEPLWLSTHIQQQQVSLPISFRCDESLHPFISVPPYEYRGVQRRTYPRSLKSKKHHKVAMTTRQFHRQHLLSIMANPGPIWVHFMHPDYCDWLSEIHFFRLANAQRTFLMLRSNANKDRNFVFSEEGDTVPFVRIATCWKHLFDDTFNMRAQWMRAGFAWMTSESEEQRILAGLHQEPLNRIGRAKPIHKVKKIKRNKRFAAFTADFVS